MKVSSSQKLLLQVLFGTFAKIVSQLFNKKYGIIVSLNYIRIIYTRSVL